MYTYIYVHIYIFTLIYIYLYLYIYIIQGVLSIGSTRGITNTYQTNTYMYTSTYQKPVAQHASNISSRSYI